MLLTKAPSRIKPLVEVNHRSLYFGFIATLALFVAVLTLFIASWLVVNSGLAYDTFGMPRSDQYYAPTRQELPIVQDHLDGNQ